MKKFEQKEVELTSLPEGELVQLKEREKQAEAFYALRQEMFGRWYRVLPYLKAGVSEEKTEHAPSFVLANLKELNEEELRKFIDEDKIREELRAQGGLEKKLELAVKVKIKNLLRELALIKKLRDRTSLKKEEPEFPREIREMHNYRVAEFRRAQKKVKEYDDSFDEKEMEIEMAREDGQIESRLEAEAEYKEEMDEYLKYLGGNPEAYISVCYEKVCNMKETFDANGRIVETPYVQEMMAHISAMLEEQPVFIHGELGSGKTELAKHLVRTKLSNPYLARWEHGDSSIGLKEHPRPADEKELKKWEKERSSAAEPFLISGHKEIDVEQFVGAIKIERVMRMSPEDQVAYKKERAVEYKEKYPNATQSDFDKLEKAIDSFFDSPVETKPYLGLFYRAMKDGRPLIIDEMNAIPHRVLIMLNDLLTKRPGDRVKPMVDDMPEFVVKEGFCVICTGNWKPEAGGLYVERQKVDAAFLSRLGLVHFDYLPQAKDFASMTESGTESEDELSALREARMGNELYSMLMVRLLGKDGNLALPENSEYKIFKLASVARALQDIFSGSMNSAEKRAWGPTFTGVDTDPADLLKENVLSLRHLIPIIERWKKDGFRRNLDDYVFLEYVSKSQ
ncbi:hypothetical protein KKC32_04715, partial [Patescibacteria group bacterium]|nr:hypothetical protein [Patescibacteria group bacterium]